MARFWIAAWSRKRELLRMSMRSTAVAAKHSPGMLAVYDAKVATLARVHVRLNRARARATRDLTGTEVEDPGHGRGKVVGRDALFPDRDIWLVENEQGARWGMARERIEAARV